MIATLPPNGTGLTLISEEASTLGPYQSHLADLFDVGHLSVAPRVGLVRKNWGQAEPF